ncbi:kinase-like protein [Rhizophagus irregularis]|uniref:Kinase-like protein n=1 Tax=Rhizophagus irregularis TaxID=588596 RepID=A0A2N1MNP9_9GLOM|nr:kinase-like protein [Rhizophagus irregularis]
MVDPFNLGGHRRSYTLDTTWNITAFFDSVSNDKDDESPATILIAKKENLARNSHSRFSMQPARRNNSKKRRSIAKEIREVEVRTFRWESRRTNREKTCSQLYELYEKQIDNSLLNNFTQDKPLPPVPFDNDNKSFCDNDSETIIDPELQSIIDTLSLISDHHSDIFDDSNSSIYTSTSTMRESFSELLITDEVMFNLIEDEISALSTRNSVNSFETLPVEVEMCLSCKRRSTESGYSIQWCKACEMKRFEQHFESWSSGNDDIDCFILESQLNSTNFFDHLEWISFDRLQDVESIGDGDTTFQAIWLDGPSNRWDTKNNRYVGSGECLVVLKCFEIPENSSSDFFDQLSKYLRCEDNNGAHFVRCYGITQDPESKEYMFVLHYVKDGNISHYLKQNFVDITWQKRLEILYALAEGLSILHEKNLIHGNLHDGNVLFDDSLTLISDLGISRYQISSNNGAYGVLPFIAPELLKNKPYTMASDIYSFGMIMWELIVGKAPFADRAHDEELATEICRKGLRPEIPSDIPECFINLLRQCWDSNPFKRPCANRLRKTIHEWISSNPSSEISIQFQQSEEKRLENVKTTNSNDDVHPEAVYTNRSFSFENLIEPNVTFTKSVNPKEHLALQQYIADETKFYHLKIKSLKAENSDTAAEIYDILQYW